MIKIIDDLNEPVEGQEEPPTPKARRVDDKTAGTLKQWKPHTEKSVDAELGQITTGAMDGPIPPWEEILEEWGYSPEEYTVVEPYNISCWDGYDNGELTKLWSIKASIVRKETMDIEDRDLKDLIREVKKHRPLSDQPEGKDTFLVCLSDWQIGKGDGDGLTGTIARILDMIDNVENRIRDLRKIGRNLGHLLIAGMGDIVESCSGHYSTQTFTVEVNRRQQIRIARRLIRDAIARWSKMFSDVSVIAVPGNHGENRNSERKAYTTVGDNDDVAIFEQVAEIFSYNPEAYSHVKFYLPEDDPFVVFEASGARMGFAHGHIGTSGSSKTPPQNSTKSWWESQVFGGRKLGLADILITGHYHHFSVIEHGQRIHIQCPAMDGGSEWWDHSTGQVSRPGTLTMVLNEHGYKDIEIV